jgi:tetratricopeptide (TPR) repeat protein
VSWENRGVFQEYWPSFGVYQNAKLHSFIIENHGDADCTAEKRDIDLLNEAIAKEPANGHYLFYLAQMHKGLQHYQEAINLYLSCLQSNQDKEEIWFSKYMLGECYDKTGDWNQALYWYLDAFQYNPHRSETLLKIANHYRWKSENDVACIFAKYGTQIPYAKDQIYFDISPLTDYQFDEELSIAAYYTQCKQDGYAAASDLLLRRNVPWHIKNQTSKNLLFYAQNLKDARFQSISCDFPLIQKGFEERYHPMNPSIQKTDQGYDVICRTVNYTQVGAKIFNTIDLQGMYRTRNFLLRYDHNFQLLSQQEIVENLPRERIRSCNVEGLEDCRLFHFKGESWFTCTTSDTNPTGQRQISLCKLAKETRGEVSIEALIPLMGPDPYRCEKNWLPFVRENQLYVIYSYDPFIIYQVDTNTGACIPANDYTPANDLSRFRGSAGPIAFDQGYLLMVHEVVQLPDYSRCYLHRFVYLDKNFVIKEVSKPFTFLHLGIEFCCSMTLDHTGQQLIMSVGIEDREAYLCFVDLSQIRSLLNPLPTIYP